MDTSFHYNITFQSYLFRLFASSFLDGSHPSPSSPVYFNYSLSFLQMNLRLWTFFVLPLDPTSLLVPGYHLLTHYNPLIDRVLGSTFSVHSFWISRFRFAHFARLILQLSQIFFFDQVRHLRPTPPSRSVLSVFLCQLYSFHAC